MLNGFRQWDQLESELYTFVTSRDSHTREQSLIAVVVGTKAEDVITVLQRISGERRNAVEEVTLDLSDSMRKISGWHSPRQAVSLTGSISRNWLAMPYAH